MHKCGLNELPVWLQRWPIRIGAIIIDAIFILLLDFLRHIDHGLWCDFVWTLCTDQKGENIYLLADNKGGKENNVQNAMNATFDQNIAVRQD